MKSPIGCCWPMYGLTPHIVGFCWRICGPPCIQSPTLYRESNEDGFSFLPRSNCVVHSCCIFIYVFLYKKIGIILMYILQYC